MSSNIQPALNLDDPSYMSADDFQKQLCTWLQNRGLLSELRAYFKSNMIEILRNTSAGSSLGLQPQAPSSPKMQAINLLVAEYMSHSKYHFSLCVFGTEVTLNKVFYDGREKFKFSQKEVLDILETLGIMRHNKQAKCIYLLYQQGEGPLLNYFLPTPPIYTGHSDTKDFFFPTVDSEYDFGIQNIARILQTSNISPEEVNQLQFSIKWICDKHIEKEKQLETNLKVEYKAQMSKYKLKLHEVEKSFEAERAEFTSEITRLKEQLSEAKSKQKEGEDKMNRCVQRRIDDILSKDRQSRKVHVSVSTSNIPMKTKASQYEFVEQVNVEGPKPEKERLCIEQPILKTVEIENLFLKQTIQKLERENCILRSDNHGFSKELDQLALRASALMAELNISQQNILRLNGILHSTVDAHQSVPLVATNPHQVLSYTGAGEEYLRTNNVIPPQYRHLSRVSRRKSPHNVSTSSSSRSRSPTESILHDAKQKLKNLEEESMIIDKRINRMTQSNSGPTHRHHLPSTPMASPCSQCNLAATSSKSTSQQVFEFTAENCHNVNLSKSNEVQSSDDNSSDTEKSTSSQQRSPSDRNKEEGVSDRQLSS